MKEKKRQGRALLVAILATVALWLLAAQAGDPATVHAGRLNQTIPTMTPTGGAVTPPTLEPTSPLATRPLTATPTPSATPAGGTPTPVPFTSTPATPAPSSLPGTPSLTVAVSATAPSAGTSPAPSPSAAPTGGEALPLTRTALPTQSSLPSSPTPTPPPPATATVVAAPLAVPPTIPPGDTRVQGGPLGSGLGAAFSNMNCLWILLGLALAGAGIILSIRWRRAE